MAQLEEDAGTDPSGSLQDRVNRLMDEVLGERNGGVYVGSCLIGQCMNLSAV